MFYLSDLLFHVIGLGCFSRPSQFLTGAFFIVLNICYASIKLESPSAFSRYVSTSILQIIDKNLSFSSGSSTFLNEVM
ncbi:hypothetical protein BQ6471_01017 [Vibrio gazogenes]|nr:hypothetical protein BQ6471_01017 [Vibrio gazogenes]